MDQNVSKYQGFDPPEAHLCGGSIELQEEDFSVVSKLEPLPGRPGQVQDLQDHLQNHFLNGFIGF